jgi:uncharacterized protein with beta-barrel porin domain
VLGLSLGIVAMSAASAQSLDIPLQLAQSSDGVRLIINIGIGGQSPRSYMFDTGSSLFNAAYSASAFGSIPSNMSAPSALYPFGLPTGVSYSYTSGNVFTGNLVSVPSLTFYATTGSASGVTLNATKPGGAASGFTVNAVYDRNGSPINTMTPLQSIPGVFGGIYGIFGAGDFAQYRTGTNPNQPGVNPNTTTAVVGSPLGQAVVAGTTAGYVVAANGQPLSGLFTGAGANPGSTVNGPQVGQSVTSCSPCVMLGLTPALIAQFRPVNTLSWLPVPGNDPQTFPNSGAPSSTEYGIRMNFSASGPGHSASWSGVPTLLDTGTPTLALASTTANLSGLGPFDAITGKTTLNQGVGLTISGTAAGASTTTQTVFPSGGFPYNSPYSTTVSDASNNNIVGVSFFLTNSVLYNLSGQAVGYTPNFVTNTDIVTTSASPLTIGSNSVPLGLAGNISGPGGVSITTGGSATLSGANTYTGLTSITGANAYLALVGPGSITASSGVTVSAGGLFDISGTNSGATIATLAGDAAGYVELGAQTLTLSNASTSFAGVIDGAGGGLHVAGGVQTLTGTSSYTGPTTVDGSGTLLVNGSIVSSSGTSVLSGGTLGGNGMVGAVAIGDGGTLMPGLPGTGGGVLTVAGPFTMTSGANYLATVSPSAASRAQIVGTALIAGTLTAYGTGGAYTSGATYNVFTASGGLTGSFSAFKVAGSFGSMTPTFSTDADDVFLTLHPADLVSHLPAGASGNTLAIAQAITAANVGTPPLAIQNLFALPPSLLATALTQASGEAATGTQQTTFDAMNMFMGTMLDPFNRGTTSTPGGGASGYASEGDASAYASDSHQRTSAARDAYAMFTKAPLAQTYDPHWSVWAAGFGGSQTTDGNATVGSNTSTSSVYGTAVGADYLLSPRTIMGFALAGGGTNFSVANSGSGHSDLFQAGAFVKHTVGSAYVSASLAYGWQEITTNRTVTAAGTNQLRAQFDANAISGRLEGGYRFVAPWVGGIGITPYAAAQFTTFDLPGYAEQAIVGSNAFALAYGAKDVTDTRSELGIRADKSFGVIDGILTLRGRVAWAHDYDPDRSIAATFQSLPGASFVVNGAAQASDSALVTASIEKKWLTGWSAAATFEGEFSDVTRSYAGKGVVRYAW